MNFYTIMHDDDKNFVKEYNLNYQINNLISDISYKDYFDKVSVALQKEIYFLRLKGNQKIDITHDVKSDITAIKIVETYLNRLNNLIGTKVNN
jgi:hypothetical protein